MNRLKSQEKLKIQENFIEIGSFSQKKNTRFSKIFLHFKGS